MSVINLTYGYVQSRGFLFYDEDGRDDHPRGDGVSVTWNSAAFRMPGAGGQGFARLYHMHNKHADGVIALCK